MDRVKAHMELDEASRQADLLSRRLGQAASDVAYGAKVDLQSVVESARQIMLAIERVHREQAGVSLP